MGVARPESRAAEADAILANVEHLDVTQTLRSGDEVLRRTVDVERFRREAQCECPQIMERKKKMNDVKTRSFGGIWDDRNGLRDTAAAVHEDRDGEGCQGWVVGGDGVKAFVDVLCATRHYPPPIAAHALRDGLGLLRTTRRARQRCGPVFPHDLYQAKIDHKSIHIHVVRLARAAPTKLCRIRRSDGGGRLRRALLGRRAPPPLPLRAPPPLARIPCTAADLHAVAESFHALETFHLSIYNYDKFPRELGVPVAQNRPRGGPLDAIAHFARNCPRLRPLHLPEMEMGEGSLAALGDEEHRISEPHGLQTLIIPKILLPPGRADLAGVSDVVRGVFPLVASPFRLERLAMEGDWAVVDGASRCPECSAWKISPFE